jgi:amidohydrolase
MPTLTERIEALMPWATSVRHEFHRHPETMYEEWETSARIRRTLDEYEVPYTGGWAGGTGVVARISATVPSARTVALRADIDALPIHEETGLEYGSENEGRMHACGHDGHTTILLTTARLLQSLPERAQNVVLIFQPAEEGGAGAKRLIEEGALNGVDAIYGLHGWPSGPLGTVSTRVGPVMAAAAQFQIEVSGRGGHAAYPHLAIDPIVVSAQIVVALQTITSRRMSPFEPVVVTVGRLEAGFAHNVIPTSAHLHGTVRALDDEVHAAVRRQVEDVATGIAKAHGAEARVEWEPNAYPVTSNDAEATRRFQTVAREELGEEGVRTEPQPSMAAEDFSFYGERVPACFFFLGLSAGAPSPSLHAPNFDFNDAAMTFGVRLMAQLGLRG